MGANQSPVGENGPRASETLSLLYQNITVVLSLPFTLLYTQTSPIESLENSFRDSFCPISEGNLVASRVLRMVQRPIGCIDKLLLTGHFLFRERHPSNAHCDLYTLIPE